MMQVEAAQRYMTIRKAHIAPEEEDVSWGRSVCCWINEKCRRFSRLAGQALILCLDIIFLVGKITTKVPEMITKGSLVLLSGAGFVFLPYTLDLVRKTIKDALFGSTAGNRAVVLLAAAKVMELLSNLGLLIGGAAASVEGFKGNNETQAQIYKVMTPWGEATIVLGLGLTVAYIIVNAQVLKALQNDWTDEKSAELIAGFKEESTSKASSNSHLAAFVRFSMDKDTLEHFYNRLEEIPEENFSQNHALVDVLTDNIKVQQRVNMGGQLVLTIGGYVLMGIEKYYTPNSLQAAAINVGVAGAYTIKILSETLLEVCQRHKITEVADRGISDNNPVLIQSFA